MDYENYVYKKEIDWSVLMEGFTLPVDNQVVFSKNMGRFLHRGESKIIHLYMNGVTYDAKIVNINNPIEKRKKDAFQIRYTMYNDEGIMNSFARVYGYKYLIEGNLNETTQD